MANIVIKKRINLDFLGEEYKGGYVNFKSLTIKEVEAKLDEIQSVGDDNKKAVDLMLTLLKQAFLDGVYVYEDDKQDINKEDLEQFDIQSITKFFAILAGQDGDPKS